MDKRTNREAKEAAVLSAVRGIAKEIIDCSTALAVILGVSDEDAESTHITIRLMVTAVVAVIDTVSKEDHGVFVAQTVASEIIEGARTLQKMKKEANNVG